jgi:hypothetical protein
MNVGTEDKKKLIVAGVAGFFAIFAVWYLYSMLFAGSTTPPPPPPVITTAGVVNSGAKAAAAKKVGTTGGELDPTLHMEAMLRAESLVYAGSGRNIFAPGAPEEPKPVKLEQAKFPVRPGPLTPPPVINHGPPPLPPINLKYFGTATSANGVRRAFLLAGDDVFVASVGDVVQRKYRVVSISANSILVEDLPNNNKQTLPLLGQ